MAEHVRHLGFELELRVLRIARLLARADADEREAVLTSLKPINVKRAVEGILEQQGISCAS